MKAKTLAAFALVSLVVGTFALILMASPVMAGNKNQNPDGSQGTGKVNYKEGCRAYGGMRGTELGPPLGAVWGGACCASNIYLYTTLGGNPVYAPNQCCNPPDFIHPQPGNHCECFAIRFYTPVP